MSDIHKYLKDLIDDDHKKTSSLKEDEKLIQKKMKVFFDAVIAGPSTDEQK